jgi:segregation and condensation protein B
MSETDTDAVATDAVATASALNDEVVPVAEDSAEAVAEELPEIADEAADEGVAGEAVAGEAVAGEAVAGEAALPLVAAQPIDPEQLAAALEAILFVVEAPVTVATLAVAVTQPVETVQAALDRLRTGYDERGAGIELREVAGGVRIYTRPEQAHVVEQFLQEGQRSKLSQAALETLAVIAYRQPVTRARVSAIRGVNVDGVVRTLLARGLIVEVGTDPETGGGLFRTTELFLEKMGLNSLDELPSLAPLLPDIEGLDAIVGDEV